MVLCIVIHTTVSIRKTIFRNDVYRCLNRFTNWIIHVHAISITSRPTRTYTATEKQWIVHCAKLTRFKCVYLQRFDWIAILSKEKKSPTRDVKSYIDVRRACVARPEYIVVMAVLKRDFCSSRRADALINPSRVSL